MCNCGYERHSRTSKERRCSGRHRDRGQQPTRHHRQTLQHDQNDQKPGLLANKQHRNLVDSIHNHITLNLTGTEAQPQNPKTTGSPRPMSVADSAGIDLAQATSTFYLEMVKQAHSTVCTHMPTFNHKGENDHQSAGAEMPVSASKSNTSKATHTIDIN